MGKEIEVLKGEAMSPPSHSWEKATAGLNPGSLTWLPTPNSWQHRRPPCPLGSQGLHRVLEVVLTCPPVFSSSEWRSPCRQARTPQQPRPRFLHLEAEGQPRYQQVHSCWRTCKAPGLEGCSHRDRRSSHSPRWVPAGSQGQPAP